MKQTVYQAFNGYRQLVHFKRFRRFEMVLKGLLLPFVLIVFTAVFIVTWMVFFIEQITAPFFKMFIRFHLKMMVLRNRVSSWRRRMVNVLTILVSLLFAPVVIFYYLSVLLKVLGKALLRSMILKMDFSAMFSASEIMLFDDRITADSASFETLFKDMDQNEALGEMLAQFFNPEDDDEERLGLDDPTGDTSDKER
ncbi:MAG: hypothetical protein EA374_02600 [Acholeplasmatales bacterium]|nr:MAG: hypothetical protein EA374_02600 [Acholeplasmatales bacterium]